MGYRPILFMKKLGLRECKWFTANQTVNKYWNKTANSYQLTKQKEWDLINDWMRRKRKKKDRLLSWLITECFLGKKKNREIKKSGWSISCPESAEQHKIPQWANALKILCQNHVCLIRQSVLDAAVLWDTPWQWLYASTQEIFWVTFLTR